MSVQRSILLIATDSPKAVANWLQAVQPQTQSDDELIVIAPVDRMMLSQDDRCVVLQAPAGTSVPRMRALAAEQARGSLLIFSEDSVVPGPGWLAAFQADKPTTGPIVCGEAMSRWNRAVFVFEYGCFSQSTGRLAGNNFAVPRSCCAGDEIHEHELDAAGVRFRPDACVTHVRVYATVEAILDRFRTGRAYGRRRWTGLARGLGLLAIPAIAWIQGRRMWALVRSPELRRVRRCLPELAVLVLAWSLGEGFGWFSRRVSGQQSETSDRTREQDVSPRNGCRDEPVFVSTGP